MAKEEKRVLTLDKYEHGHTGLLLINYQINKILKPSYLFYAKLNE